jgi:hypothetical protein
MNQKTMGLLKSLLSYLPKGADIWDALAFLGVGLINIGILMIYIPAGIIFAGLSLAAIGMWGARVFYRRTAESE